jgi:4,5-DOPA dioxygenase extradiol
MNSPLFLAHGSPMLALEDNAYGRFLDQLGTQLHPQAVVVFTAHWESEVPVVTWTDGEYETIYDFYGFPDELYQVKYPAKGSATVAQRVLERFQAAGIPAEKEEKRGLDHGSWVLLSRLFPRADVPVVQISVNPFLDGETQFRIGQALQGLGEEGILVIGSGGTVHNLRRIHFGQTRPEAWAVEFDDWLLERIRENDFSSLFAYDRIAPNARLAVPRAEHFVPFLLALGSGGKQPQAEVLHRSYEYGTLSYLAVRFSEQPQ